MNNEIWCRELLGRLDGIFNNADAENSLKAEQLFKFYQEVIAEELKNSYKQAHAY